MDVEECIRTRRSIRRYKDNPVDWEKIVRILEGGKFAPSSGNVQNWKFIVVRKDEVRRNLIHAAFDQDWMEDAPVFIVVASEPQKGERLYGARGERLYSVQNCAAATQNMILVANNLGLGSCWVGAFDEEKVREALNMPESAFPQAIITVGYTDEKPQMPSRVELEHTVYLDRWFGKGQGFRAKGYKSVALKETIDNTRDAMKKKYVKEKVEKVKEGIRNLGKRMKKK
jgi:nitroreductase